MPTTNAPVTVADMYRSAPVEEPVVTKKLTPAQLKAHEAKWEKSTKGERRAWRLEPSEWAETPDGRVLNLSTNEYV